jgi:hypothetical protein
MVLLSSATSLASLRDRRKEHNPSDWRIFVDSSQRSLKTVLLRNENSKHIPIAHPAQLKGTYGNTKVILEAIQYSVPWRSEGNRYVGGYARRLYEVLLLLMPLG